MWFLKQPTTGLGLRGNAFRGLARRRLPLLLLLLLAAALPARVELDGRDGLRSRVGRAIVNDAVTQFS